MEKKLEVSVISPVFNERENLKFSFLFAWLLDLAI